jgi:hypothetical protein
VTASIRNLKGNWTPIIGTTVLGLAIGAAVGGTHFFMVATVAAALAFTASVSQAIRGSSASAVTMDKDSIEAVTYMFPHGMPDKDRQNKIREHSLSMERAKH